MNRNIHPPISIRVFSRLLGWSLLAGGLTLSLLADSLSGLGALAGILGELGFPAGTICVAGCLLLALNSSWRSDQGKGVSASRSTSSRPADESPSMSGASELKKLEDRLIAELDRRHEGLRGDLHEMAAILEANLERGVMGSVELPLAAGAELSSHQLRPALRKLGPQAHSFEFTREEDEEELHVSVELDESTPDETLLWSQDVDYLDSGDTEDRLTGEVMVDDQAFDWNLPATGAKKKEGEHIERSDEEPRLGRENTQWFDRDEDEPD